MLTNSELDADASQIAQFQAASERHNASLSEVVEKYATLMKEYKLIKSDYEEARESRERYKQAARGAERNSFVLVLIDGDGYIFDDDLVSDGVEGGQRAALLLDNAVKNSLRARGLEHCRIVVRIYANMAGVSKTLAKIKLVGPEKRSLGPFFSSFTRSNDLFDFLDAGDLEAGAGYKVRAMFRHSIDNLQCQHVFFAGCHDVGYLSELSPYSGSRDRITLIRSPAFHHEFSKLGLRVEDFPNVFRTTPLDISPFTPTNTTAKLSTRSLDLTAPPKAQDTPQICAFYQRGTCGYGESCRFLHVNPNNPNGTNGSDWRQKEHSTKASSLSSEDFASMLPRAHNVKFGQIAVNRNNHRLDTYVPPPSAEDKAKFNYRTSKRKLCNNYHLVGPCPSGPDCQYDHKAITSGVLDCLRQVTHNTPCPRRGECRKARCINGHICQKPDCRFRGGPASCKLGLQEHSVDLLFDRLVDAADKPTIGHFFSAQSRYPKDQTSTPASPGQLDSDENSDSHDGALLIDTEAS